MLKQTILRVDVLKSFAKCDWLIWPICGFFLLWVPPAAIGQEHI